MKRPLDESDKKYFEEENNIEKIDLFDNIRYDKMKGWERERRRKKPKMKYGLYPVG
jgi:hypothetical protein